MNYSVKENSKSITKNYYVERTLFLGGNNTVETNLTYKEAKSLCDDCNKNYSDYCTWYEVKKIK